MKPILGIGIVVVLLGVSCRLPQRTKTFIPPTNERDLCRTDSRFVYSQKYGYCFRLPTVGWQLITHTGHRDTAIASVTSDDFFRGTEEALMHLFTVYVGPNSDRTQQIYKNEAISIVHADNRYLIGFIVDPDFAAAEPSRAEEIPGMLSDLYFFTPDGTRQAVQP